MTTRNIPPIDVDEVMKKIRAELERRKRTGGPTGAGGDSASFVNSRETRIWRLAKGLQQRLKKYAIYETVHGFAIHLKRFIPRFEEHLTLGDFLCYYDEEFIQSAYRRVLHREADRRSLELYLTGLREGTLGRIEILGRLRYSREGRREKVKIRGLLLPFAVRTAYRVPVAGYIFELITGLITFPSTLRALRAYEAMNEARSTRTGVALRDLEVGQDGLRRELSTKAESSAVNDLDNRVKRVSEQARAQEQNILKELGELTKRLEGENGQGSTASNGLTQGLAEEARHLLDPMYVAFEDRFRGTRQDIKDRVKTYLPYVERIRRLLDSALVLDIGCGRGEWLELLKENGFRARGLDLNRVMVQQCRDYGFDVEESDAIEYLGKQPPDSIGIITGFHIVEHLPFDRVVTLFDNALRALKPGGLIIFETPNPENLLVGACNFYADPTHRNPYPPEPLKFIAEQRGFVHAEILRLHKLKDVEPTGQALIDEVIQRYNMEQDFALIGYKK